MSSARVVPAPNSFEDLERELLATAPLLTVQQLALHGLPELSEEDIVDAGGNASHGTEQPRRAASVAEHPRRVLRSPVGVDDGVGEPALPASHLDHVDDEFAVVVVSD